MPTIDSAAAAEDRTAAARAIKQMLLTPVLRREHSPEAFADLCQHREEVRLYFQESCGWVLWVDARGGVARLAKDVSHPDSTRPAMTKRSDSRPFNRRRYALMMLVCAVLDSVAGHTGQILMGEIGDRVAALTANDAVAGVWPFDPDDVRERRALVDAVNHLVSLGVVTVTHSTGQWDGPGSGNALLEVDRRILARLLTSQATDALEPTSEESALEYSGRAVMRRVLDDPVVYLDDLTDKQRAWLAAHSAQVEAWINQAGMVCERRAEGLAAVDESEECTDIVFPGPGSIVNHAALLLASKLAKEVADLEGAIEVPMENALAYVTWLLARHPGWAKGFQDRASGPADLTRQAVNLLDGFGLVRATQTGLHVLPAVARFAPTLTT